MTENFQDNNNFANDIKKIESDHKEIDAIVKSLCSSIFKKKDKAQLKELLEELDKVFGEHFVLEEAYMEKYNYENAAKHKEAHDYFKKTYEQIRYSHFYLDNKNFPRERILYTYSLHLCRVLTNWLKIHFATLDKYLIEFLHQNAKDNN